MLVEVSFKNFLSFKDKTTFSMVSAPISEMKEENCFEVSNLSLLRSSVIYGANAGGKSNLLKGLIFIKKMLLHSFNEVRSGDMLPITPFRLDVASKEDTSFFEVVFFIEQSRYRYGFELDKEKIHAEWLFKKNKAKEAKLFIRENQQISCGSMFSEGEERKKFVKDNALFLSVVEHLNGDEAEKIFKWFKSINFLATDISEFYTFSKSFIDESSNKEKILELLKGADIGIEDISRDELKLDSAIFPEKIPELVQLSFFAEIKEEVKMHHTVLDNGEKTNIIEKFRLDHEESLGTRKLFAVSGPILDTLLNGKILFIDELDSQLHPLLTRKLINLFNSKDTNPKNAQLIFTTHDTSHLSKNVFRRDQIWFVEKDKFNSSQIYSLVEFKLAGDKKIRKDASYEKDYIQGKYGAIPFVGDFSFLEEEQNW